LTQITAEKAEKRKIFTEKSVSIFLFSEQEKA
jgi:hypothetical protein